MNESGINGHEAQAPAEYVPIPTETRRMRGHQREQLCAVGDDGCPATDPATGDRQCLLVRHHDASINATPHLFAIEELEIAEADIAHEDEQRVLAGELERVTFDELIEIGKDRGAESIGGLPWSFTFHGVPVTHESDTCYLVDGQRFERGDVLVAFADRIVVERPAASADTAPSEPSSTEGPAIAPAASEAEGGGVAAAIEPWTCKCGVANTPVADALIQKCGSCGEVPPAEQDRIKAGLQGLGGGVATADDVESVARSEEGLPPKQPLPTPKDRMLPYRGTNKAGRFDALDALDALKEARERVEFCQADHDADVKRAKASGNRLKEAQDDFNTLFDTIYERKEKADIQPGLDGLGDDEGAEQFTGSECPIERETGAPCPACQSQRAKKKPAEMSDPLHPAHPQHADVAKALMVKDRDELIATLITKKKFYIDAPELSALPVSELQILQRYAVQKGVVPPPLLARAHVAAEAGTDRQECRRCATVLVNQTDLDAGDIFYPAFACIGLDCPGDREPATTPEGQAPPSADAPAEAAPEAAVRKPRSHARKDLTKRAQPEQEKQHQTAEGRRRKGTDVEASAAVKTTKAKSAKKTSAAKKTAKKK